MDEGENGLFENSDVVYPDTNIVQRIKTWLYWTQEYFCEILCGIRAWLTAIKKMLCLGLCSDLRDMFVADVEMITFDTNLVSGIPSGLARDINMVCEYPSNRNERIFLLPVCAFF